MKFSLRLAQGLIAAWTVLASHSAYSSGGVNPSTLSPVEASSAVSNGWESYFDRPDILSLEPREQTIDRNWHKLRDAHFSFVAQLLAIYPSDTHIYFLARDSEYIYDVARLVTEGTDDSKRLHLLNVSRGNMRDPHLRDYLAENGISEDTIRSGQKILFVDTGFAGTIPRVIADIFPEDLRPHLKTHLIASSNKKHPSSRSFLLHINPAINESHPYQMHGTIVTYENMPHYTDTSKRFERRDGRWQPLSQVAPSEMVSVSKKESLLYMSDLRAEWLRNEVKVRFEEEMMQFQTLQGLLQEPKESALPKLQKLMTEARASQDAFKLHQLIAHLSDLLEAKGNTGLQTSVSAADLGIDVKMNREAPYSSKKNELIEKYPEWAPILENPVDEIPQLFQTKNWQMIGNLIDANVDYEINKLIANNLFAQSATGIEKTLQIRFIENAEKDVLIHLAHYAFSTPAAKNMADLLGLLIERSNNDLILLELAQFTFSQPHTKDMRDLLKIVVEKSDDFTRLKLAQFVFTKPHTKDMTDLQILMIEKADPLTLDNLAKGLFSQPYPNEILKLLRLIIERADADTLLTLSLKTFAQTPVESSLEWRILQESLKIPNRSARKAFIANQFKGTQDLTGPESQVCARFLKPAQDGAAADAEMKARKEDLKTHRKGTTWEAIKRAFQPPVKK